MLKFSKSDQSHIKVHILNFDLQTQYTWKIKFKAIIRKPGVPTFIYNIVIYIINWNAFVEKSITLFTGLRIYTAEYNKHK